jgi:hypothetical protein
VAAALAALDGAGKGDLWLSYLAAAAEFEATLDELRRAALTTQARGPH